MSTMTVQRAIAWVVAVTVLAQSTACSYVPARPDERTCEQEKAEVLAAAKVQTGNQDAIFFNATIDGRRTCATAVPKDVYDVQLFATWSDGRTEKFQAVQLSVEPGRQYSVLAYETNVGHVPATAMLVARQVPENATTYSDGTGRGVLHGVQKGILFLTMPIWVPALIVIVPVALLAGLSAKQAASQGRRAATCCYVWIEDARTREIFAGTAPAAQ